MTSPDEGSLTPQPESRLEKLISSVSLPPEELERRRLGDQRLKERLSQIPWYEEQGRLRGEQLWENLYGSCILS
jgi:hypothetical protein